MQCETPIPNHPCPAGSGMCPERITSLTKLCRSSAATGLPSGTLAPSPPLVSPPLVFPPLPSPRLPSPPLVSPHTAHPAPEGTYIPALDGVFLRERIYDTICMHVLYNVCIRIPNLRLLRDEYKRKEAGCYGPLVNQCFITFLVMAS